MSTVAPAANATLSRNEPAPAPTANRHRARNRLLKDRLGLAAISVLLLFIAAALLAPILPLSDPIDTDLENGFKGVGTSSHILGTDLYGRDMLSRLVWGARSSLLVGFVATCLALSVGVTLGVIVGYYGGRFDTLAMRVVDVMLAFPYLLLAIVIVGALGPGLFHAVIAVAITAIPFYIRLIRGMVISFKHEQFVDSARALGAEDLHIMRTAILPNVMPYIIVAFSINIGYLILEAASLSFLGLGAQPPSPEWGATLAENRNYLTLAPHTVVVPGVAIFLIVISLNLVGDALRDAFDVRLGDNA